MYQQNKVYYLSSLMLVSISCLLLSSIACEYVDDQANLDGDEKDGPQVKIEILFKPENSTVKAKLADIVTIHYKGYLESNGAVFDSIFEKNETYNFQIGKKEVIPGWEKGLIGACVGEKRKLTVPPELAYGDEAVYNIPARATLVFEIEVVDVKEGPPLVNIFKQIDENGDKKLTRDEVTKFITDQFASQSQYGDEGTRHEDIDIRQMVEEIFNHEDKNKDSEISLDEFSGPKVDHHDEL